MGRSGAAHFHSIFHLRSPLESGSKFLPMYRLMERIPPRAKARCALGW
jgi:hypothetical protein